MSLASAVVFAAAAVVAATVYSQRKRQRSVAPPDPFGPLAEYVERLVNDGIIPFIAVRLDRGGQTVYRHEYGVFSTPLVDEAAFTTDTIARFYSMTKPITSAAILVLLEQVAQFDLDKPISLYIPEWDDSRIRVLTPSAAQANATAMDLDDLVTEPACRPITTRDLLTHSSGLSYGFWGNEISLTSKFMVNAGLELPFPITDDPRRRDKSGSDYPADLRDFCMRLQSIPLVTHPGEEFHYSCSSDVLGRLVECLDPQRRSLPQFFDDVFFKPLGMTDTSFTISADELHRMAPCFCYAPLSAGAAAADQPDGQVIMMSPAGNECQFKLARYYSLGTVSQNSPWHVDTTNGFQVSERMDCVHPNIMSTARIIVCVSRDILCLKV
jgi:CubicO group peptidase (beta-lactamase class C family)